MTYTKAKLWARLIYKGHKSIGDVAEADQAIVRNAYEEIYGVAL